MKKFFLFSCLMILNFGCSQNKKTTMNKISVPQEKQLNYIVDLTLKTPHELYINDILATSESRGSNAAIEVNPYVLKNGKYKIRLKLLPFWQLNETTVNPEDIKNSRIFFGNYIKNRLTDKAISYNADIPLSLNIPSKPVPFFEQEWEVDIKELPYELESGKIVSLKEEEIKSRFVNTFFGDVLGYNYGNSNRWLLREEKKSKINGTKPDAVLGYFFKNKEDDDVRVVIEIKDAKTSLDDKQKRVKSFTPVEQAFNYGSQTGGHCKWVIVSNINEIRFYPYSD